MSCCDNERHTAISDYRDAVTAAISGRVVPTFTAANVEPPLAHITIKLSPERELAWTPGFGWRVTGLYPATGTPAGKALYLDAGPFPAPAVVADRLTAWADGHLNLTDMQPYYPVTEAALIPGLRDAVSGRPVQYRCPHCDTWDAGDDLAYEDSFCGECGAHMPLRSVETRVTPATALDGTEPGK